MEKEIQNSTGFAELIERSTSASRHQPRHSRIIRRSNTRGAENREAAPQNEAPLTNSDSQQHSRPGDPETFAMAIAIQKCEGKGALHSSPKSGQACKIQKSAASCVRLPFDAIVI